MKFKYITHPDKRIQRVADRPKNLPAGSKIHAKGKFKAPRGY